MAQGSTITLKQKRTREALLWLGMERRSMRTSNPKEGVHGGLAGRTAAWTTEDGLVVKRRLLAVVKLEESREAKTGAEKTRGTQRPLGPAQPRRPGLQHQEGTGSGLGLPRLPVSVSHESACSRHDSLVTDKHPCGGRGTQVTVLSPSFIQFS